MGRDCLETTIQATRYVLLCRYCQNPRRRIDRHCIGWSLALVVAAYSNQFAIKPHCADCVAELPRFARLSGDFEALRHHRGHYLLTVRHIGVALDLLPGGLYPALAGTFRQAPLLRQRLTNLERGFEVG